MVQNAPCFKEVKNGALYYFIFQVQIAMKTHPRRWPETTLGYWIDSFTCVMVLFFIALCFVGLHLYLMYSCNFEFCLDVVLARECQRRYLLTVHISIDATIKFVRWLCVREMYYLSVLKYLYHADLYKLHNFTHGIIPNLTSSLFHRSTRCHFKSMPTAWYFNIPSNFTGRWTCVSVPSL